MEVRNSAPAAAGGVTGRADVSEIARQPPAKAS